MGEICVWGCERDKGWNSQVSFLLCNVLTCEIAKLYVFYHYWTKTQYILSCCFFFFPPYLEDSVLHVLEYHWGRQLCCLLPWHLGMFWAWARLWMAAQFQSSRETCNQMKNRPILCGPHLSQLWKAVTFTWVAEFLAKKGSKFIWSYVNSLQIHLKNLISKLFMFSNLEWLWTLCMMKKKGKKIIAKEQ